MLRRICRIQNHPISNLPDKIKEKYLRGLACVLYNLTDGHPTMKMLFEQWAISVMGRDMSHLFTRLDEGCIKKALSLNRIGFHFFRCKHEFFFDCYHLLESFSDDEDTFQTKWRPKLAAYLVSLAKNAFTEGALRLTNNYFKMENATLKVPENIIEFNDLNFAVTSEPAVRILVIATVSAGKSTLINALIGYDFNKVKTTACTDQLCYIYNKRVEDGITYWRNGLYEYDQNVHSYHSDAYSWVGFHFNAPLGNENICLIDTPGVNNSLDTDHWMITTEAIKGGKYDAVLFISNSQYNGTSDERNILEFLCKHCEKPVVFALNQLDRFKSSVDSVKDMIADTIKELKSIGFKNPDVYPISALYAFFLRRENLLDEEDKEELEILRKRFSKDYYNLPQYIGCDTHSEIDRAGITCLEDKLFNICEEIYNNHGQEDVVTDVQQRNVEFKLINVEKDVYRDSRRGMIIKTSFVTYGLKGIKCNLGVYFYDSNGTPLTVNRANGANASTDEHIYVGLDLIPDYDSTTYTDIELYMFYDDFHLIKKRGKKYDLKFLLGLYDYEKNRYVGDAFSDYHEFTISY